MKRPAPPPQVTVVVVHHGDPMLLESCLAGVRRGRGDLRTQIVVVENAPACPADRFAALASDVEWVLNPRNAGFAAAANQGLARAAAPLVLFLNNDVVLGRGDLDGLVVAMDALPSVAALAPMTSSGDAGETRDPRRRFLTPFMHAAGLLGLSRGRRAGAGLDVATGAAPLEVEGPYWLEACALLVRRDLVRAIGGFDEGYFFYEEDEDLCWRLRRRGHGIGVCPHVCVVHEGGASARRAGLWPVSALQRGQARFVTRRHGWLAGVVHRVAVTAAMVLRRIASRRRDPFAAVMEGLWTSPAAVSTEAV